MKRAGRSAYFGEASKPRVEVIPMIDIMMFLLVFFVIISLQMIAGTGIALEIPGSRTTQELKSSTLTIGVSKDGEVVVDGEPVTPEALGAKLVELKQQNTLDVVIAGDRDTSLQQLMGVMDTVRGAGINSVAIAAKAEAK
jgi:biopolymer transport protein ExbD